MIRRAILIESSNVAGQTELPGARIDVRKWREFLKSDLGGAWTDDEITTLNKPWPSQVQTALTLGPDCYCFVAFSGHGCDGAVVLHDHYQEFPISSLKPKTNRAAIVIDACRGPAELVSFSASRKVAMANEYLGEAVAIQAGQAKSLEQSPYARALVVLNRLTRTSNHRTHWDTALQSTLTGTVEMLACAKGQDSNEHRFSGGYYTTLLMQSADRWDQRSTQPGTHSTKDAHDYAASLLPPQQTPEYSPSWLDFPFAVKI
jgi:hypothetical protein